MTTTLVTSEASTGLLCGLCDLLFNHWQKKGHTEGHEDHEGLRASLWQSLHSRQECDGNAVSRPLCFLRCLLFFLCPRW